MRLLVFTFFITILSGHQEMIWAQSDSLSPTDSLEIKNNKNQELSESSYIFLKATMDSILLEALNQQTDLQRDIDAIKSELSVAKEQKTKDQLELQLQRLTIDQNETRELRRKAIDLQLGLSYNPTSLSHGKDVRDFLRSHYDLHSPALRVEPEKETNERFYFQIDQLNDKQFVQPCNLVFDEMDYEVKKRRKETISSPFFNYTNPKLKSYFKNKNYLNCSAACIKLGKDYILNLDIIIASKDANRSYGYIEKSSIVMFEFINGERVYGEAIRRAKGVVNQEKGVTVYDVFYKLDKSTRKELSNREISQIGLFWTTGFEKYNIYEVDLLMNQLKCIN